MKTPIFNIRIRLLPILIMIFTLNGISPPLEGAGGGLYAQDPQLFEHTWYLQKVVIEDEEYINSDYTSYVGTVDFFENDSQIYVYLCEYNNFTGNYSFDPKDDAVFYLSDFEYNPFPMDCSGIDSEYIFFANIYFSFFYEWDGNTDAFKNPFTYSISTENESKTLIIINADGDEAHYSDEPLSVQGFDNAKLSVYPNPVSEVLYIQNSDANLTNLNIKVYDINGSMVLSQAMETSLNVKELKSGLYFLSIESKEGYRQVLKFVKK